MRITGGVARGIPISTGRAKHVRPATDRMREAVFSSLGDRIHEAAVLAHLQVQGPHRNIVGFLRHHVEGAQSFLVLEAAHHDWFDDVIALQLTLAQTRTLFLQAMAGVCFMHHTCRTAHLDIKLENMMVHTDGRLVHIDFGLSRRFPDVEPSQALIHNRVGSP